MHLVTPSFRGCYPTFFFLYFYILIILFEMLDSISSSFFDSIVIWNIISLLLFVMLSKTRDFSIYGSYLGRV